MTTKQTFEDESKAESAAISKEPDFFLRHHIIEPIEKDHADLALLACSLVTGMVDAATFSNWGAVHPQATIDGAGFTDKSQLCSWACRQVYAFNSRPLMSVRSQSP